MIPHSVIDHVNNSRAAASVKYELLARADQRGRAGYSTPLGLAANGQQHQNIAGCLTSQRWDKLCLRWPEFSRIGKLPVSGGSEQWNDEGGCGLKMFPVRANKPANMRNSDTASSRKSGWSRILDNHLIVRGAMGIRVKQTKLGFVCY